VDLFFPVWYNTGIENEVLKMKSAKIIKKILSAAARNGYVAISYDKRTKLYQVDFEMNRYNMNIDELYTRAFYPDSN
jgi:hypothetical protein